MAWNWILLIIIAYYLMGVAFMASFLDKHYNSPLADDSEFFAAVILWPLAAPIIAIGVLIYRLFKKGK